MLTMRVVIEVNLVGMRCGAWGLGVNLAQIVFGEVVSLV